MAQLSLNITPRLLYGPDNFYMHQGVKRLFEDCSALLEQPGFRIAYLSGGRRCGKTHFSIKLAHKFMAQGVTPLLLEGAQLGDWIKQHLNSPFMASDLLLIDDADQYLGGLRAGDSGPLVALIEALRVKCAGMLFLSSRPLTDFAFDEHAASRLRPGVGLTFGPPAAEDMFHLIKAMAMQRGIALTEHKVRFLEKRLERDISAVEAYFERLERLSGIIGKRIDLGLIGDAI